MNDIFENIDDYNPSRKRKILIVFDNMIADIMTNKEFQSSIKELFIRCRKLNISLVFSIIFLYQIQRIQRENYKILQLIILQTLIIKIYENL